MALVSTLGAGNKQMVEIARAVHHHARVLIFDEPTASLTPEEKFHFFNLVRRLQRDGMSVIFISHALEGALTLSDRITVLRDGGVVATDATRNFDRSRPVHAMVGRNLSGPSRSARRAPTAKKSSACAISPWAISSATPRSPSSRDRSPACSVWSAQDERRR
jgi:ABC-type sugar transport system ATPase subunit